MENAPHIHILWPTICPDVMRSTFEQWMSLAVHRDRVFVRVAVNTKDHRRALADFGDVLVVGDGRKGAAYPTHMLFRTLVAEPRDIVESLVDHELPSGDPILAAAFRFLAK